MNVPLYVHDPRAVLRQRGGRIVAEIDGTVVASAPVMRLAEVVILGKACLTTAAMHALLGAGVPVVLLTADGRALGRLEPPGASHVHVRRQQLALSGDPVSRVRISRAIVAAKIHNQRTLLVKRAAGSPHRDELLVIAAHCDRQLIRVQQQDSVASLVGVEGAAARAYFAGVRLLTQDRTGFRRRDRHGRDVVNVLVNYCSALLRETVVGALTAVGLDLEASFLHEPFRSRPTLAFDLMEEWRPVLLETTVLSLVGLGRVGPDSISLADGRLLLSPEARTAAIQRYRKRLASRASSWPPAPEGATYEDVIRRKAQLLRSWVRGDAACYEGFQWR